MPDDTTSITTRRTMLAGAAVLGAAALAEETSMAQDQTQTAQTQTARKTFVLVHGSWHGGWCWRRVADGLEAKGHKVYAPTLSGLGERCHLMSGLIDLNTHITDIVNVIRYENLENIVLVGHSYAGWIITGAAEQVGAKIASIIYLDAFLPADGDTLMNSSSQGAAEQLIAMRARGEVSRPVVPAAGFGVNEKDQAWVNSKLTPQPLGPAFTAIKLTGACEKIAKKTYIRATGYKQPAFDKALAQCKADRTWKTFELATNHDVMVDRPDELTTMILDAA